MGALHLLEEGKNQAARDAVSPTDESLLKYLHKIEVASCKLRPRTRMLCVLVCLLLCYFYQTFFNYVFMAVMHDDCHVLQIAIDDVQFVMLYHIVNGTGRNQAVQMGKLREDLNFGMNF